MKQQDNGQSHTDDAYGNKQENEVIPPVTGIALAIILFLLCGALIFLAVHDYIPDNAKRAEVFLASMFSLAVIIVVIIQAGIYFRQARVLDAQLRLAGDALIIGNRSLISVSVESNIVWIRPICIYLENVGRVPASEIDIRLEILAYNDTRVIYEQIEENYGQVHLQPGSAQLFLNIKLWNYLPNPSRDAAVQLQGMKQIGLRGCVTWQDGFESQPRQRTNFCFDYERRSIIFPISMDGETEERWIPSDPRSWDDIVEQATRNKEKPDNPN
jgi:hypothetical protein